MNRFALALLLLVSTLLNALGARLHFSLAAKKRSQQWRSTTKS